MQQAPAHMEMGGVRAAPRQKLRLGGLDAGLEEARPLW
jgi:hypothetical protein